MLLRLFDPLRPEFMCGAAVVHEAHVGSSRNTLHSHGALSKSILNPVNLCVLCVLQKRARLPREGRQRRHHHPHLELCSPVSNVSSGSHLWHARFNSKSSVPGFSSRETAFLSVSPSKPRTGRELRIPDRSKRNRLRVSSRSIGCLHSCQGAELLHARNSIEAQAKKNEEISLPTHTPDSSKKKVKV